MLYPLCWRLLGTNRFLRPKDRSPIEAFCTPPIAGNLGLLQIPRNLFSSVGFYL